MPLTFDDDYSTSTICAALRVYLPLRSTIASDNLLSLEPANFEMRCQLVKKVCGNFLIGLPSLFYHGTLFT
jgi:hypothetical protein